MLTQFQRDRDQQNSNGKDQLKRRHRHKWIVLETIVRRGSGREVILDYPLAVANAPVRLVGELNVFQDIALSGKPQKFIVAAQLESCRFVSDPFPMWVIRLNSDPAFQWKENGNLRALGFPAGNSESAKSQGKVEPAGPFENAILDGEVKVGMTPKQAERAMLVPPTTITRVATHRTINEVWAYGEWGQARRVVHFQRRRKELSAMAKVVGKSHLPAETRP